MKEILAPAKAAKKKKAKAKKTTAKKTVKEVTRKTPKGSFDRIAFGKDMVAFREKKGFSQLAIEAESGIPKTTWQGVEAAQKDVSADVVARICKFSGLKPANYFKI
jgi:hypothetical protein